MSRWQVYDNVVRDREGIVPTWVAQSKGDAQRVRICLDFVSRWVLVGGVASYLPRGCEVVDRTNGVVVAECADPRAALSEAIACNYPDAFVWVGRAQADADHPEWGESADDEDPMDHAAETANWIEDSRLDAWERWSSAQSSARSSAQSSARSSAQADR